MKYLKYFETEAAYAAYKNGSDFITPNVSYIEENAEVSYTHGDFIIMTSESNPEVMKVCYNQGWAASPYEMYASEAASVTSIGTAFQDLGQGSSNVYGGYGYGDSSSSFASFDEFKYFTGVTTIEYQAFYNSNIVSINIPDSVTIIGNYAFENCVDLMEITIGAGVTSISSNAFYGCTSLPVIDGIVYADTYLLGPIDATLTTYNIQEGTKWIGSNAFRYCSNLTSINIPDSVTSIGNNAFEYCSGLTSINIPDGVTTINTHAFNGCSGLTSIVIPDSVTTIGNFAFYCCSGLTSINIPDSVTSIEYSAFNGCSGLTSIVIPDSVTTIGDNVFNDCTGLTSINIPDSVTSIGFGAFWGCSGLTSIVIPDSVTTIGDNAFYWCSGLKSITCYAPTAPSIKSNTFYSVPTGGTLYVPSGSDYGSWMSTRNYYLGKYNWTIQYI